MATWRNNNVIMTSKRRRDFVLTHNDVIIASRVHWVDFQTNMYRNINSLRPSEAYMRK